LVAQVISFLLPLRLVGPHRFPKRIEVDFFRIRRRLEGKRFRAGLCVRLLVFDKKRVLSPPVTALLVMTNLRGIGREPTFHPDLPVQILKGEMLALDAIDDTWAICLASMTSDIRTS
jgi:hypothetical protein